jgi:hypothetical protein
MTVTLDSETGIVTIDGQSDQRSFGDANFGCNVDMTVTGSGTASVTVAYVITANLEGGTADPADLPNPATFTCVYTAEKVKE